MDNNTINKDEPPKTEKISNSDNYISYSLLQQIIKETNIPKKVIEEKNSELWYETLSGKGKVFFTNNTTYSGFIKNGILDTKYDTEQGQCTLTFADGTKYEGEVHNNHLEGKGTFTFPSNSTYKGDIHNGLRHGYGVYSSPEGVTYEGEWKNGLKHGKGKMVKPSMSYDGEWKEGAIEGEGVLRWENGNVYIGHFKANCIYGDGYMIWNDINEKYIGEWSNNLQHGKGIHIWYEPRGELKALRNRYIGEWQNGIRNGYGVFLYSNGSWFEGIWENNCKEGFGVFTFQDGRQYIGRFEKDRMIDKENQLTEEQIDELMKKKKEEESMSILSEKNKKSEANTSNSNISVKSRKKSIILKNTTQNKIMEIIEETQNEIANSKSRNTISPEPTSSNKKDTSNKSPKNKSKNSHHDENKDKNTTTQNNIAKNEVQKEYKYSPFIDIDDLIMLYPEIQAETTEIRNIFFRQLTDIKHLYNSIVRTVERDTEELLNNNSKANVGNTINRSKSNNTKGNVSTVTKGHIQRKQSKISGAHSVNPSTQAVTIAENEKSNDFSFSMSLKDLWRFMKESGLINIDCTLSDFDRLYYNCVTNNVNFYLVPDYIKQSNDIYDYMRDMINESKEKFILTYQQYIDYYYMIMNKTVPPTLELSQCSNKKFNIDFSIHNKNNIILPRFFNNALIRIAFIKYANIRNSTMSQKIKNLLGILITPKAKKSRSSNRSSLSRLEQSFNAVQNIQDNKAKLQEKIQFENFCINFEDRVVVIFKELYEKFTKNPNPKDQTITYRFFYKNIIRKSKILRKLIASKSDFAEIINYNHKDKLQMSQVDSMRYFSYCENLFNLEMIQYEFEEVVFLICKKYIFTKKLQGEPKDYEVVIDEIKSLSSLQKEIKTRDVYYYPTLKKHQLKMRMLKDIENRKLLEAKRQEEIKRYTRERHNMDNEKDNVYIEEEEAEEDEEFEEDY